MSTSETMQGHAQFLEVSSPGNHYWRIRSPVQFLIAFYAAAVDKCRKGCSAGLFRSCWFVMLQAKVAPGMRTMTIDVTDVFSCLASTVFRAAVASFPVHH